MDELAIPKYFVKWTRMNTDISGIPPRADPVECWKQGSRRLQNAT
jgi:hypothetical protein